MNVNEPIDEYNWEENPEPKEFGEELSEEDKYLPSSPLMQDFHSQVQLYGKLALVFGLVLGLFTLIFGVGLAYLGIAIGAYGLIERKKWGLSWSKVSLWFLFAISGGVVGVFSEIDHPIEIFTAMPISISTSILMIGYPSLVASLAGLVIVYSKKMKYYCE